MRLASITEDEVGQIKAMKFLPSSALLAVVVTGCSVPGAFNGEWVKGDWDTRSALANCQRMVDSQSYPAKCEVSEWSAKTEYGEVWLVNTASNDIQKIWKLSRQ
jgi:hypothetical protein